MVLVTRSGRVVATDADATDDDEGRLFVTKASAPRHSRKKTITNNRKRAGEKQ